MNTKDPYGVPMGVVPRLAKRGMSNLRQAAQAALEALESLQGGCTDHDDGTVEAITVWCPEVVEALRAALAEPQPDCERRPFGDLRNAKWLDPECYEEGACQSLKFKQAQQPQPKPVGALPPTPDLGPEWTDYWSNKVNTIMRNYAQQAVEAERERCAKVCEKQFPVGDHDWRVSRAAAEKCAAAIRGT